MQAYRRAARAILRDRQLSQPARAAALLKLVRHAKSSTWPEASCTAIVAEVAYSIDMPEMRDAIEILDRLIVRHRRLRARGATTCTRCLRPLMTAADEAEDRALRDDALSELNYREGAVSCTPKSL